MESNDEKLSSNILTRENPTSAGHVLVMRSRASSVIWTERNSICAGCALGMRSRASPVRKINYLGAKWEI